MFCCRDVFCAGRVPDEDLKRTMKACGGMVQTSVNDLTPDVLGTCETFEEEQIGGERYVVAHERVCILVAIFNHFLTSFRYNIFIGCPQSKTCTIIMRGGAEQFMEETERSLHDAIMIVRRAIKNDAIVAGACILTLQNISMLVFRGRGYRNGVE